MKSNKEADLYGKTQRRKPWI